MKQLEILKLIGSAHSSEIITPQDIATDMIAKLPESFFKDPTKKVLDPCVKSGVFLKVMYDRFRHGLKDYGIITGDKTFDGETYDLSNPYSCSNYIFKNILFGIAVSRASLIISSRILYGVGNANENKIEYISSDDNYNKMYDCKIFTNDINYDGWEYGNIFYPKDYIKQNSSKELHFYPLIEDNPEHDHIQQILNKKRINKKTNKEQEMIIDCYLTNPPFHGNTRLHQKIFNRSVKLVAKNGYVLFIAPATPYENRPNTGNKAEQEMENNILRYPVDVELKPGGIFLDAEVGTDLAITLLHKEIDNESNVVDEIEYITGKIYKSVPLEYISKNQVDPFKLKTMLDKFKTFIDNNEGNLQSIIKAESATKKQNQHYISIPNLRGHVADTKMVDGTLVVTNNPDYYTIFASEQHLVTQEAITTGIECLEEERDNLYNYLTKKTVRFAYSMYKINMRIFPYHFSFVPIIDFSKTYTDEELYVLFGFNEEEIKIIEEVIMDWNHYSKKTKGAKKKEIATET